MRRRSKQITLLLMAGSAITLTACGETADAEVVGDFFTNKAECAAVYSQAECDKAEKDALNEHAKNAPKFATREQCEAEFGPEACQPTPTYGQPTPTTQTAQAGGGSSFMPFMMGYMLGNIGNGVASSPVYYAPGSFRMADRNQRPLYSSGGYAGVTPRSGGKPVGFTAPRTSVPVSTSGRSSVSRTAIVSPSVRTGGVPSSSSIARATSGVSRAAVSTSSRGGFGSIGAGRGGGFS